MKNWKTTVKFRDLLEDFDDSEGCDSGGCTL